MRPFIVFLLLLLVAAQQSAAAAVAPLVLPSPTDRPTGNQCGITMFLARPSTGHRRIMQEFVDNNHGAVRVVNCWRSRPLQLLEAARRHPASVVSGPHTKVFVPVYYQTFWETNVWQEEAKIKPILDAMHALRAEPKWRATGCFVYAFTLLRQPRDFYRSQLYGGFLRSRLRYVFSKELLEMGARAPLPPFPLRANVTQLRTLMRDMQFKDLHLVTGTRFNYTAGPAASSPNATGAAMAVMRDALDALDFVGLTHRMDEVLAIVQAATGLPSVTRSDPWPSTQRGYDALPAEVRQQHDALLDALVAESQLDAELYGIAQRRFTAAVAAGGEELQRRAQELKAKGVLLLPPPPPQQQQQQQQPLAAAAAQVPLHVSSLAATATAALLSNSQDGDGVGSSVRDRHVVERRAELETLTSPAGLPHLRRMPARERSELLNIHAPVPCALVLHVHTERTGGSTLRSVFFNENRHVFTDWMGFNRARSSLDYHPMLHLAETDPQDFRHRYGRVYVEAHCCSQNVIPTLRRLRALAHPQSNFTAAGCKAFSFSHFRSPLGHLMSQVGTEFGYSLWGSDNYKAALAAGQPPAEWSRNLVDASTRLVLYRYFVGEYNTSRILSFGSALGDGAFEAMKRGYELIDWVGLTRAMDASYLVLQQQLGLQHLSFMGGLVLPLNVSGYVSSHKNKVNNDTVLVQALRQVAADSTTDNKVHEYVLQEVSRRAPLLVDALPQKLAALGGSYSPAVPALTRRARRRRRRVRRQQ